MASQESNRERPRILLLEDNIADAKLTLRELARAGFETNNEVVPTSRDFIEPVPGRSNGSDACVPRDLLHDLLDSVPL
jgi:hypothetical protein